MLQTIVTSKDIDPHSSSVRCLLCRAALLTGFALLATTSQGADPPAGINSNEEKQVIGATATVEETESDFNFKARVDTGATTSSLHVEDWKIIDESPLMANNVGKTIHFRIKNHQGKTEWLTRKIVDIGVIKTSEQQEQRYKVRMSLKCHDVKKRVLVSLNDRSHMHYPVLLGRNFLQGDFVVDVDLPRSRKAKREKPCSDKAKSNAEAAPRKANS